MNPTLSLHEVTEALVNLTTRFIDLWQKEQNSWPHNLVYNDTDSPCVISSEQAVGVFWQPIHRKNIEYLTGVERGMEMQIQTAVHHFYGSQYAGDLFVSYEGENYSLLQVWNDEDFIQLQENIIAHLVAQRRSKRTPSVFIGTTQDDDYILSCCNLTGHVLLERLSKPNNTIIANDLIEFLMKSQPKIQY